MRCRFRVKFACAAVLAGLLLLLGQMLWQMFVPRVLRQGGSTDRDPISAADFALFLQSLQGRDMQSAQREMRGLFEQESADSISFANIVELSEKMLYDPNSLFRNEELYVAVLQYVIDSDKIDSLSKLRPRFQLDMALKNRIGSATTDFMITMRDGSQIMLSTLSKNSQYTMLLFNNPDCADCERVKQIIERNRPLLESQGVQVVAVYTDADLCAWRSTQYPAWWVDGYDQGQVLNMQQLYDLKAIPALYLLDAQRRVLLKDAPVERIMHYLRNVVKKTH